MEKNLKPPSGFPALVLALLLFAASVYFFIHARDGYWQVPVAIVAMLLSFFIMKGLMIVQPNHSRVLNLFWQIRRQRKSQWHFLRESFLFYAEDQPAC